VQVAEPAGRTAPHVPHRQRPLHVTLEQASARDVAAERRAPHRILDGGAAELRHGTLADREVRDPAEHFAKTEHRRRIGRRFDHQMQRPAPKIERGELDNRARTGRGMEELLGIKLEPRALKLELGPPR
jgi:hypothetical protein